MGRFFAHHLENWYKMRKIIMVYNNNNNNNNNNNIE